MRPTRERIARGGVEGGAVIQRLIFAAGAGGVVGAAWGLAESILTFLQQEGAEGWTAEMPAFATAMAIYAAIGAVVAIVWTPLLRGAPPASFRRRIFGLTALAMMWFFGGLCVHRFWLPSFTSASSLGFTALWTLAASWVGYSVLRSRGTARAGDDGLGFGRLALLAFGTVVVAGLMLLPGRLSSRSEVGGQAPVGATGPKRPNVLVIVLDTVRADHLSVYGYPRPTTPGLERLAAEGVVFEQALAPAPWTLPSHATLFTGLYPAQHGSGRLHPRLDGHLVTLTELLAQQGYQTVGFSNNSWVSRATNFDQGFEYFEDFKGIWRVWRSISRLTAAQIYQHFFPVQLHGDRSGGAGRTNAAIRRWFDSRHDAGRPFFLFINYLDAHFPYHAPEPFRTKFVEPGHLRFATELLDAEAQDEADFTPPPIDWDPAKWGALSDLYDGELAYLDAMVSELLADLRRRGLLDQTLVVITSDHGEHLGEHSLFLHRFSVYEPTLRIPLLMRLPGRLPAGLRTSNWVGLTDVLPTVLRLVDVRVPIEVAGELPGQSLVGSPVSVPPDRMLIGDYEVPSNLLPRYRRRTKVSAEQEHYFQRGLRSVHHENWKFIWATDGRHELYDLSRDSGETNNLVTQLPEQAAAMQAGLQERLAGMSAIGGQEQTPELDPETREQLRALGYVE
jgi:arylsulfatase A-like enzyme